MAEDSPLEGTSKTIGALLSPEGMLKGSLILAIMLPMAIILDIAGIVCAILYAAEGIGLVASFIPDIIGIVFFIPLSFLLSQKVGGGAKEKVEKELLERVEKRRRLRRTVKMAKAAAKGTKGGMKAVGRVLITAIGEIIPILGDIFPFWTIMVLWEFKILPKNL